MGQMKCCPKCGASINIDAQSRFCLDCGADLQSLEAKAAINSKNAKPNRSKAPEPTEPKNSGEGSNGTTKGAAGNVTTTTSGTKSAGTNEKRPNKSTKPASGDAKSPDTNTTGNSPKQARGKTEPRATKPTSGSAKPKPDAIKTTQGNESKTPTDAKEGIQDRTKPESSLKSTAQAGWSMLKNVACVLIVACIGCFVITNYAPWDFASYYFARANGTAASTAPYVIGPVFVPTSSTSYYSSGDKMNYLSDTLDEHGNLVERSQSDYATEYSDSGYHTFTYSDFDKDGYCGKCEDSDGEVTTYTYEKNDNAALSTTWQNSSGTHKTEYTYRLNGLIWSTETEYDDYASKTDYDENGYIVRQKYEATDNDDTAWPHNESIEYNWEFGLFDRPEKCTVTTTNYDYPAYNSETTYSFACDLFGNITEVRNSEGELVHETKYKMIIDPTTRVWIDANTKNLYG